MKGSFSSLLVLLVPMVLAACSTTTRAPVEDRSTGAARRPDSSVSDASPIAKPGHYIVKRGDTLIGIALEQGQDWRDIASWNNLENPNLILVGQEIRVKPLEGETVAVGVSSRPMESKPLDAHPAHAEAKADHVSDSVKRDPRGGKIVYSDQALAAAIKADAPGGSASRVVVSDAKAKVVDVPKAEVASEPHVGDDIDWAWPASGKVLGTFNDASNKGLDIAGAVGDPVHAAGAGKIVYVGAGLRGYGNLVIIKHNAIFLSAYAHNQKILVKEGQAVKKGQEIAILGDSDTDRPKLHFEIRRQGKPIDPMRYLPKR